VAQHRIRDLEEKLALLNDGSTVPRAEYERLEMRLHHEQDDNLQVSRGYRELKTRYDDSQNQIHVLEEKLAQAKAALKPKVETTTMKDAKIAELELRLARYESLDVKNNKDAIQGIAERKRLLETNKRFEAHVADLDRALAEMINRNKELTRSLAESQERNDRLSLELANQKKIITQMEHSVARARKDGRETRDRNSDHRLDHVELDFADAKQQLLVANHTIRELQSRVEVLEKFEKRSIQLQSALNQRDQEIIKLQDSVDQSELELQSLRVSAEEFRKQIDIYRDERDQAKESEADHIQAMKVAIEQYRKRTDGEFKRNATLQQEVTAARHELQTVQDELAQFLSGTYGLPQAVNELRQLKVMVSVRDAQIADMIQENGWYQKVVSALEAILPATFNFEQFYERIEREQEDAIRKQTSRKAIEFIQRTLASHKNAPIGEIKIILGAAKGKRQTIIVSHNASGELEVVPRRDRLMPSISRFPSVAPAPPIPAARIEEEEEEEEEEEGFEEKPSHAIARFVSSDESGDSSASFSEGRFDLFESTQKIARQQSQRERKLARARERLQRTRASEIRVEPTNSLPRGLVDVVDAESQTTELDHINRDRHQPKKLPNEDDWVHDLRRQLSTVQDERDELQRQLNLLNLELENRSREASGARVRVDELRVQLEQTRAELRVAKETANRTQISAPPESSSSSEAASRRRVSIVVEDDPLKAESRDVAVQVIPNGVKLSISVRPEIFEAKTINLSFYRQTDVTWLPSPSEMEVIEARNNALGTELTQLREAVARQAHGIEDLQQKLDQRDQMLLERERTIATLDGRLNDQRAAFQEKITEMNEDAERILEARLREARDMDAVAANRPIGPIGIEDLSAVSARIARLNADKATLQRELSDATESARMLQRRSDLLKKRVDELEAERLAELPKPARSD
jgi:hypothetical protein